MSDFFETYTLVVNSGSDWEAPKVVKTKGFRVSNFSNGLLHLEPQGLVQATKDKGVDTRSYQSSAITKAVLIDSTLHIPQSQFGTIVYSDALVLAVDNSRTSILRSQFGISTDNILAEEIANDLCKWRLFVAKNGTVFSLNEFKFKIHDGYLEELQN